MKKEELRELLGIEEYLDMKFDKGNGDWEPDWDKDSDANDLPSSLAMDVYCKRKRGLNTKRAGPKAWYRSGNFIEDWERA